MDCAARAASPSTNMLSSSSVSLLVRDRERLPGASAYRLLHARARIFADRLDQQLQLVGVVDDEYVGRQPHAHLVGLTQIAVDQHLHEAPPGGSHHTRTATAHIEHTREAHCRG